MRTIKLTIEYDGSGFHGWQRQPPRKRTVQGAIEDALKIILGKTTILHGSGRTDSGVHAAAQVAHFRTTHPMDTATLVRALNANLPEDIRILAAREVPASFHAQHSVLAKTYRYTVVNRPVAPALSRNFALHVPVRLNAARMRRAAGYLVGRHDFRSFQAADPAAKRTGRIRSSVRTVHTLKIIKRGPILYIDIEANGFLYKMVRNIVGALLEVGAGRQKPAAVKAILDQKDRRACPKTAPAHGLCLLEVRYPKRYSE